MNGSDLRGLTIKGRFEGKGEKDEVVVGSRTVLDARDTRRDEGVKCGCLSCVDCVTLLLLMGPGSFDPIRNTRSTYSFNG